MKMTVKALIACLVFTVVYSLCQVGNLELQPESGIDSGDDMRIYGKETIK